VRAVAEGIGIFELLDRLEELLDSATRLPFSARVIVDQDEALDILDRLRAELPDEYQKAQEILDKREAVLLDARRQAADILGDARSQVARMVEESEISRIAKQEREAILAEAERSARETRIEANEYARSVLSSLERSLRRVLDAVVQSKADLEASLEEVAAGDELDEGSDEQDSDD